LSTIILSFYFQRTIDTAKYDVMSFIFIILVLETSVRALVKLWFEDFREVSIQIPEFLTTVSSPGSLAIYNIISIREVYAHDILYIININV